MAAVSLVPSSLPALHSHRKRSNWASRERGVILVWVIVFLVGSGVIALFVYRKWQSRKAIKESHPAE